MNTACVDIDSVLCWVSNNKGRIDSDVLGLCHYFLNDSSNELDHYLLLSSFCVLLAAFFINGMSQVQYSVWDIKLGDISTGRSYQITLKDKEG